MVKKLINEVINTNEAISYARVSSFKQEDNFSRAAQEKTGIDYAKRGGLRIIKSWSCVESATRGERKSFKEMLDYAKRHRNIQHIIFDVTDRMTRNDMDKIRINDLIINYGKIVHFARTGKIYSRDSSPDDEFMLDIEVAAAKKMAKDIARKTKMGMHERAEQGWYPAYAPVGYLNKDKVIAINEEMAQLIVEAFKLMANGNDSLSTLADKMYAKGLRTRKGKRMCDKSLDKMLKNKMYYGIFEWGAKEYVGKHQPIITKEIYDKANASLSGRNVCIHKSPRNHPFAGLIDCPLCNHRLVGDAKGGDNMYYRCSSNIKRHAGQKIKYLTEKELLERAETIVKSISIPENVAVWMQKCVDKEVARLSNSDNKEVIKLKKQLTATETKLQDLKDNGIERGYPAEIITHTLEKYKKEIADFSIQISSLQTTLNPNSIKAKSVDILQFVSNLGYVFKSADKHQKAELLKKLGERYAYDYDPETKDKKLLVVYREPYNLFVEGNKNREAFLASHNTNTSKYSNSQIWGG